MVADLKAAVAAVGDDPAEAWNEFAADTQLKPIEILIRLVDLGRESLAVSEADCCPLCALPFEHARLESELAARAESLSEKRQLISAGRAGLEKSRTGLSAVKAVIASLIEAPPDDGWREAEKLKQLHGTIDGYLTANTSAAADLTRCDAIPRLPSAEFLAALDEEARDAAGSATTAAMLRLKGIHDQCARLEGEQNSLDQLLTQQRSSERMLAIAEEKIEATIRTALDDLSGLVGEYFNELAYGGLYSDIELVYDPAYSGGVEFKVNFDGRKPISPPQAIMSTSQLNALGLALFLARAKKREPLWRTLVLDDVINSFDGSFRQGLIRILVRDFSDWQVLLLTHDRAFADLVQRETGAGWRHKQIARWTAAAGPILAEGDARQRLRELLNEGASAAECSGWARQALEQELGFVVAKLEYPVPYRPSGRYTAGDFIRALRKGLSRGNSDLAANPVLARIEGDNYMAALGVHGREDSAALSAPDFRRLIDDLDELERALTCPDCNQKAWATGSGNSHTCACSKLAA
jgi:hypothetical protein